MSALNVTAKIQFRTGLAALLMLLSSGVLLAQSETPLIRQGNKSYKQGKYADSELSYRKSLEKNNKSFEGEFNLGDALYKQGKYEEAAQHFSNIASNSSDKVKQADALHNLGNSLLQQKKYQESIEAYKKALKNSPNDKDTKYNLAYAQQMIRQEQQQQQQQKDNKQDKQQQEEEKKNQQGDKKEQQQEQDKKQPSTGSGTEKQKEQEQKQQQAGKQKDKISKEDAERILQALNQDEKNTQKKLSRKEASRIQIEKDW